MAGKIFIVSGPSGVGKTSLLRAVLHGLTHIRVAVSHTTRPPRCDDREAVDYHFVSADEFVRLKRSGAFLETATVFGYDYATSHAALTQLFDAGCDAALEIDYQGAAQVRAQLPNLSVFMLPPSLAVLRKRLEQRDRDSATTIAQRSTHALDEMRHWRAFDFVIVNENFDHACTALRQLFSERSLSASVQAQAQRAMTGMSL